MTPDILLILNESFYDVGQITDIKTDIPYLNHVSSIENTLTGYAITPSIGGGTNSSEYELLTSNSLQLMPGITPFNTLDLYNATSIVSHLDSLGYSSIASHPQDSSNYSRAQGYPALGFDSSFFISDFNNVEFYHDRNWYETDESIYKNMIKWYEDTAEQSPHFQYMLTIQNHGNWEFNDPKYDLVHVQDDYGEFTEPLNEYLTGIHLSDVAFKNLTDYFSSVDRPVIICMVGDHAPNFASSIIDSKYSEEEKQLLLRKVPLVIWANFPLKDIELGTISMNYVVPTVLDLAQTDLTPYYSYLLHTKESVPIISSYGYYFDNDGNSYKYAEDSGCEFEHIVDNYFYLEYNNLHSSKIPELFIPYNQQ